jgi:hypothetical protein
MLKKEFLQILWGKKTNETKTKPLFGAVLYSFLQSLDRVESLF